MFLAIKKNWLEVSEKNHRELNSLVLCTLYISSRELILTLFSDVLAVTDRIRHRLSLSHYHWCLTVRQVTTIMITNYNLIKSIFARDIRFQDELTDPKF